MKTIASQRALFVGSLLFLACGGSADSAETAEGVSPAPEAGAESDPSVVPEEGEAESVASPSGPPAAEGANTAEPPPVESSSAPVAEAKSPPAEDCRGQQMTFDEVWSLIQTDIFAADVEDQPFLRYLSLSNRYNAGVCAQSPEMDQYRWGLQKAVNSVSSEQFIERAEPIDAQQLVFRIDTRHYGWDDPVLVDDGVVPGGLFDDRWEAITQLSPFGVTFEGDEADQVIGAALTDRPLLMADALIDVAAVGNLYYALLNAPPTLQQLLGALGVDELDNQQRRLELRAGTTDSAVSRQDRTVTRNPIEGSQFGAVWQSFDFLAGNAGDSIFANPFDSQFDNSQLILTLANGMLGFAIYDAQGIRLEESDVINDAAQGDFIARTSVSCTGCHAQGLLPVVDEVSAYAQGNPTEFDADTFEDIVELYASPTRLGEALQRDNFVYQNQLSETGTPLNVPDPLSAIFHAFDADVDLRTAAGDLGVVPGELRASLSRLAADMQVVSQGTLDRDDFAGLFLQSLCIMQSASTNRPNDADCQVALGLGI